MSKKEPKKKSESSETSSQVSEPSPLPGQKSEEEAEAVAQVVEEVQTAHQALEEEEASEELMVLGVDPAVPGAESSHETVIVASKPKTDTPVFRRTILVESEARWRSAIQVDDEVTFRIPGSLKVFGVVVSKMHTGFIVRASGNRTYEVPANDIFVVKRI